MRTCPDCATPMKAHGEPKQMSSGFVDQVVVCQKCGWIGVVSFVYTKESPAARPDYSVVNTYRLN